MAVEPFELERINCWEFGGGSGGGMNSGCLGDVVGTGSSSPAGRARSAMGRWGAVVKTRRVVYVQLENGASIEWDKWEAVR